MEQPTLRGGIAGWSAQHAADFPAEIREIFACETEKLFRSGFLSKCVDQNDVVPDFSLSKQEGSVVQLREKFETGSAILSFYRCTWCPDCNLEFQELLDTRVNPADRAEPKELVSILSNL